jgi:hypothetical protein
MRINELLCRSGVYNYRSIVRVMPKTFKIIPHYRASWAKDLHSKRYHIPKAGDLVPLTWGSHALCCTGLSYLIAKYIHPSVLVISWLRVMSDSFVPIQQSMDLFLPILVVNFHCTKLCIKYILFSGKRKHCLLYNWNWATFTPNLHYVAPCNTRSLGCFVFVLLFCLKPTYKTLETAMT